MINVRIIYIMSYYIYELEHNIYYANIWVCLIHPPKEIQSAKINKETNKLHFKTF